ncbi:hypothetical protein M5689_021490 [Euphorbia peplus]|nr:hypothetical protein M5689_021490 [Euphorbia peplus]
MKFYLVRNRDTSEIHWRSCHAPLSKQELTSFSNTLSISCLEIMYASEDRYSTLCMLLQNGLSSRKARISIHIRHGLSTFIDIHGWFALKLF